MKTVEMRRVVITGVGAVTPVGNTAEEFWAALIQGKSGIGPITRFDATPLPTKIAGELKGFDPLRYIDKKDDRKLDPFLKYAIACAVMAVEDAGLNVERVDRTR
ncbi:MAG TPA: beta-ketoacyl synthase N-terminal-like domain-containing protein, partial [Methylomirabilota bacterium]|nr:beta-ketoacyl synthase N-terminal-like domain-containing protein [Methylomirabilota bacterium]